MSRLSFAEQRRLSALRALLTHRSSWSQIRRLLADWPASRSLRQAIQWVNDCTVPVLERTLEFYDARCLCRATPGLAVVRHLAFDIKVRPCFRHPPFKALSFARLVEAMPNLSAFSTRRWVSGRKVFAQLEWLADCRPALSHLRLIAFPHLVTADLLRICAQFPALRSLTVRGCAVDPLAFLDQIDVGRFDRLELGYWSEEQDLLSLEGRDADALVNATSTRPAIVDRLRHLPAGLQRLWAGDAHERLVLRDWALENGHLTIARGVGVRR
ncbi:MAG: hypothetical protein AAGA48_15035 [Myxococcota bacterium]